MSRRLVLVGRKRAEYHTIEERIDNHSHMAAAAHGLIPWSPKPDPEKSIDQPDPSDVRKQNIEDAIARGDDL